MLTKFTKEIILTDEQERAASLINEFMADPSRQVFLIHGLAGTGKTMLLAHTALLHDHASLCTLTGKAASILRRKTGLPAQTVHSFFYNLIEVSKDKKGRTILKFEKAHHLGQLHRRLVLADEVSMIDEMTASDLRRTGAKIIATGDPGQLPPVKGDPGFTNPDCVLTEIHRQALDSPIIRQAHRVRSGNFYQNDGPEFRVHKYAADSDLRNAEVVLCWTNRTRRALNQKCRILRGYWQPYPQIGEPLMCMKNVTSQGIFNGAVYRLLEPYGLNDRDITIDVDGAPVVISDVNFEGITSVLPDGVEATTAFGFGYAMTVHKAQGSEWDNVVLIDEYRKHDDRIKWVYTGITRAAQNILVVR